MGRGSVHSPEAKATRRGVPGQQDRGVPLCSCACITFRSTTATAGLGHSAQDVKGICYKAPQWQCYAPNLRLPVWFTSRGSVTASCLQESSSMWQLCMTAQNTKCSFLPQPLPPLPYAPTPPSVPKQVCTCACVYICVSLHSLCCLRAQGLLTGSPPTSPSPARYTQT